MTHMLISAPNHFRTDIRHDVRPTRGTTGFPNVLDVLRRSVRGVSLRLDARRIAARNVRMQHSSIPNMAQGRLRPPWDAQHRGL